MSETTQGPLDLSKFKDCIGEMKICYPEPPYCRITLTDNGIVISADPRVELRIEIPQWMLKVDDETDS